MSQMLKRFLARQGQPMPEMTQEEGPQVAGPAMMGMRNPELQDQPQGPAVDPEAAGTIAKYFRRR